MNWIIIQIIMMSIQTTRVHVSFSSSNRFIILEWKKKLKTWQIFFYPLYSKLEHLESYRGVFLLTYHREDTELKVRKFDLAYSLLVTLVYLVVRVQWCHKGKSCNDQIVFSHFYTIANLQASFKFKLEVSYFQLLNYCQQHPKLPLLVRGSPINSCWNWLSTLGPETCILVYKFFVFKVTRKLFRVVFSSRTWFI